MPGKPETKIEDRERKREREEKKEQPKTRERTGREIIAEEALFVITAK